MDRLGFFFTHFWNPSTLPDLNGNTECDCCQRYPRAKCSRQQIRSTQVRRKFYICDSGFYNLGGPLKVPDKGHHEMFITNLESIDAFSRVYCRLPLSEIMVREFMGEVNSSVSARLTSRPPQSFHMGLLLEEMRILEKDSSRATVQTGPNVAALAADWADQYNYSHVDHGNDGVWVDDLNLKDMEEQWDRAHAIVFYLNLIPFCCKMQLYWIKFGTKNQRNLVNVVVNPWEAALLARQNGDFPTAVLLLEEAARQSPEKAQIWLTLGLTLAQNEQDPKAIQAFKKCLTLKDCAVELQLEAYMALAVSLTNEAYQVQAVEALREWLERNPKYSHLAPPLPADTHLKVTSLLSGVEEAFLAAARLSPVQDIDADVQTGLGVLLHLAGDYEKAADCFRAALSTRPQDAQLWNRLGATLANGGLSEEAVEAYRQALELCPGFIRSRYNVAVACINLGAHEQACEHLVAALSSQQRAQEALPSISPSRSGYGSGMSDNLWSSLRTALAMSGRHDLLPDTEKR
nr:EOG090X054E [Triops cancriformis]